MLDQMLGFFLSGFKFPGLDWQHALIAIGLAVAFGALWLAAYRSHLFLRPKLWLIGLMSALFTWTAIAFIQVPLQALVGQALTHFLNQFQLLRWLLLAGIPSILLSGLVQEGAKLVPVVFYWWRRSRQLEPKTGLLIGAISGAGFGIFEAIWVHNSMFAAGWTWQIVSANGFIGLVVFWERLAAVGLHIAVGALAGYGLARGKGWQFYLLAAFLHALLNYSVVLMQKGLLDSLQLEIYASVVTLAVSALALWLRWRRRDSSQPPDTAE